MRKPTIKHNKNYWKKYSWYDTYSAGKARVTDAWSSDRIQFARLLSEINATVELTAQQKNDLCISMDLEWSNIDGIFERAETAFQNIKKKL